MSDATDKLDSWIRSAFVELNTELEEIYFRQDDPAAVEGVGDDLKATLLEQGNELVKSVLREGPEDTDFRSAFDVLGDVGLLMASLRRHEVTNPDRETESPLTDCSTLALQLGKKLGVAPRFGSPHLSTYNYAVNGVQKSFTSLKDEKIFHDYNLYGILFYKRAADALMHIPAMGVSASATALMLKEAKASLNQVTLSNKALFDQLDTARFFYCIRPYFKPYRVGKTVYRGANAGDFSGVNQIDLLLGLCRADDPHYSQILEEKLPFIPPEEQSLIRRCMAMRPLLDEFLDAASYAAETAWFRQNCSLFLAVCKAHGQTAGQHHNMLVKKYIEKPATDVDQRHLKQITASGPPLEELLTSLQRTRDLRMAAKSDQIETAYEHLETLRKLLD